MEQEMATKMEQVAFSHKIGASFFYGCLQKMYFYRCSDHLIGVHKEKIAILLYQLGGEGGGIKTSGLMVQ